MRKRAGNMKKNIKINDGAGTKNASNISRVGYARDKCH